MNSVVMRPAAVCSPNSRSCVTSCALLRLHLLEDLARAILGQVAEQVGGGVGVHFLDDVGGAVGVERLDNRHLDVRVELLERLGGDLFVERFEHGFALGGRQVFDDVGDVGRMHLREAFVGNLQLDPAGRVGLEQIDELPRDDARRNLLEQRAQRERRARRPLASRRMAPRAPTSTATTLRTTWLLTGVESSSTSLTRTTLRPWTSMICWSSRSRLSSSTPSDGDVAAPTLRRRSSARTVAPHDLSVVGGQHALAVGGPDDQDTRCGSGGPAARSRFRAPVRGRCRWHRARWRRAVPTGRRGTCAFPG